MSANTRNTVRMSIIPSMFRHYVSLEEYARTYLKPRLVELCEPGADSLWNVGLLSDLGKEVGIIDDRQRV